jgi:radical SAM superfamily enzyme YgiQ (UPF0313 family)
MPMKVLLVHPPLSPGGEVVPPLGLCTLASWLLHLGHEVRIVDLDLTVKSPSGGGQERFAEPFLAAMEDFRPGVVAVTSMYSNSLQAERLVRAAKGRDPACRTVAGGPHFGAQGLLSLRRIRELDYVVEGEGESAFAALLDALEHGSPVSHVPRLYWRHGSEVCTNPPGPLIELADLPPMWVTLGGCIDLDQYARTIPAGAARRVAYLEAGRGCPFACTFCATAPFWQRRYRVKPVGRLVDEIRYLHENHGYDSFVLVHDLLTANPRFVSEFSDALMGARLPVAWMANSRTDIVLRGLLPKMKAAGCWKLFLGVESASARVQARVDKHLEPADVYSHIADLADHGISATCSFVIGFPDESPAELSSSLAMGARLKALGVETVQFHRLRLFPPSPLSRSGLPVEFDLDSLRIEYPFVRVPQEDVAAIAGAPDFFEGYFAPRSEAGSAAQLAQVEMFFHHAIANAPLTVGALSSFAGDGLVGLFYGALSEYGGIDRGGLDWESGDRYGNWLAVRPLLEALASRLVEPSGWRSEIVHGLLGYEARRLQFMSVPGSVLDGVLASGGSWAAVESTVDIAGAIERLGSGSQLTADLLSRGAVIFVRREAGAFDAYTLDGSIQLDHLLYYNINTHFNY